MLEQLEQQPRWRYGLRACGHCLQLGLIEKLGVGRELWEFALSRNHQVIAWRDDGMRLRAAQFSRYRMEVADAR